MIVQTRLKIENRELPIRPMMAYPLYAWLLSHISTEEGNRFHEQKIRPVHQYLWYDMETQEYWWIVNLLDDEAIKLFLPVLKKEKTAQTHHGRIAFTDVQVEQIESANVFVKRAGDITVGNRFSLEIVSPTTFKQDGRYVIFPQESLILQSLITKWGMCFPDMPLDDPDAMQAILRGLHIVDYRLQTVRYPLKQTKIPSFVGRVVLEVRLPAPLLDVFKTLYCFAPYAGLGTKTALGMGGIQIKSHVGSKMANNFIFPA